MAKLGTKQLNLDMVAPHIRGGQGIFQGGERGGKAIFKVYGGGQTIFQVIILALCYIERGGPNTLLHFSATSVK